MTTSLTPFSELLSETVIQENKLKTAMLQVLVKQKAEIDDMDMMGDPVLYINSMDVFNVNLAFTQQFVEWMELHKLGLV